MNVTSLEEYSEQILVGLFLVASGYMYIGSYSFSEDAATFPRLFSAVAAVLAALILLRPLIPDSIEEVLFQETSLGQSAQEEISAPADAATPEADRSPGDEEVIADSDTERRPAYIDRLVTFGFATGYLVLSYLVGLLWASPVFVAVYFLYHRKPWFIVIGMSVLCFLIVYGFMEALYLPLDDGVLVG